MSKKKTQLEIEMLTRLLQGMIIVIFLETSMKVERFNIGKPIDITWAEFGKTLRDIQYSVAKALNHCMTVGKSTLSFPHEYP